MRYSMMIKLGLCTALSAATPAMAVIIAPPPAQTVYIFTGLCFDCGGIDLRARASATAETVPGFLSAHGRLVLANYTPGSDLTTANFVSFRYTSTNYPAGSPFSITSPTLVSGSLPATAGPADVHFEDALNQFSSSSEMWWGAWNLGPVGPSDADNGLFGTFTPAGVPEPATWAMMIGGFGLAGGALRRRAKVRTTVSYACSRPGSVSAVDPGDRRRCRVGAHRCGGGGTAPPRKPTE